MPREAINNVTLTDPLGLKVGWQPVGSVQVGVEGEVRTDEPATGTVNVTFVSGWVSLDRQGCNRLISVVRRARDAAFGRDE